MASLEDQLAAAIKAQNDLTQAVTNYKAQIDASISTMKAQTEEALKANRVYSSAGVTRVRSLVSAMGLDGNGLNGSGVYKIKTPIDMMSNTMVRFDIKGYAFQEGKVIDLVIVTYIYSAADAPDGSKGYFAYTGAQRLGNSTKNGLWLGEDPSTGKACVLFGVPKAFNYCVSFTVDATFSYGPLPSFDPKDWKVELDGSDAPAANASTGFGLINLLSL